jgi:hypothetical protein
MLARASILGSWIAGFGLVMMLLFVAPQAKAGGNCCGTPTPPPPCNCQPKPPCCAPPTPPPYQPPPCCSPPGHNVNIPGVNVNVGASVNVVVNAQASAGAFASGSGSGAVFVGGGGGGGGGFIGPGATGMIPALNVEGSGSRRTSYQAQRSRFLKVVIQAFCLDDREVPHPASQVFPDRDVDNAYEGEIFRCIAGSRMQYTWSEFNGQIDFSSGHTITCNKGEALYYSRGASASSGGLRGGPDEAQGAGAAGGAGGALTCRPQKPARDCNERSLLRRFGAGVKVLTMMSVETYTAYREESTQSSSSSAMSLDGGVGGIVY